MDVAELSDVFKDISTILSYSRESVIMTGVYRVPLKRVFNKKNGYIKGDMTWDIIYSKSKCLKCKQHFKEGEPYVVVIEWKGATKTVPVHKYQHVECKEKVVKKRVKVQNRSSKPKNVQGLRKKTR
jgi:hypothetical protein